MALADGHARTSGCRPLSAKHTTFRGRWHPLEKHTNGASHDCQTRSSPVGWCNNNHSPTSISNSIGPFLRMSSIKERPDVKRADQVFWAAPLRPEGAAWQF